MADIIEEQGVALVKADSQPESYKHQLEKFTKIPVYYIVSKMHKDAMLSQLQSKIRQHALEIPANEVLLVEQLRKYRRGKRTGDDLVDALAFSCYEPAEPLEARSTPTVLIL